jgi:hypothetical protein
LNRRSAALYGAELTQPGYQQRIAESLIFRNLGFTDAHYARIKEVERSRYAESVSRGREQVVVGIMAGL